MTLALGGVQVTVVGIVMACFSIVAVGFRLWSRHLMKMPLAFNDYMAVLALVLTIGMVSDFISACFFAGLGYHVEEILATDPQVFARFLKFFLPGQLLWAAANTSVKFSILSLYTVIFSNKKFSYICYATMAVTTAYLISVILEGFVLCKPVQYGWDKSIPDGRCEGENIAYLVAGITNLVIDAVVVALPMPMLFRLRMSLPKKLGVAAMFSLGGVIWVMSLLRVLWLQSWDLSDLTYSTPPGAIYSILEPTLGVVNSCLPIIKPAINKCIRHLTNMQIVKTLGSTITAGSTSTASRDRKFPLARREADNHDFLRLHDDFPLTTLEAGPSSRENDPSLDAITITRRWDVENAREETPNGLATP